MQHQQLWLYKEEPSIDYTLIIILILYYLGFFIRIL